MVNIEIETTVKANGEEKASLKVEDKAKVAYPMQEPLPAGEQEMEIVVGVGKQENFRLLVIKAAVKKQPAAEKQEGEGNGSGSGNGSEWEPAYPTECGCAQLKFKTRHDLTDGSVRDSKWIDLTEDRMFTPHNADPLYEYVEDDDAKGKEKEKEKGKGKYKKELEYLIFKNNSDVDIDKIEVYVARGAVKEEEEEDY